MLCLKNKQTYASNKQTTYSLYPRLPGFVTIKSGDYHLKIFLEVLPWDTSLRCRQMESSWSNLTYSVQWWPWMLGLSMGSLGLASSRSNGFEWTFVVFVISRLDDCQTCSFKWEHLGIDSVEQDLYSVVRVRDLIDTQSRYSIWNDWRV